MSNDKTKEGKKKGLRINGEKSGHEAHNHSKQEKNAGSSTFNQGSAGDPGYNDGVKVSDEEKRTGHRPLTSDND